MFYCVPIAPGLLRHGYPLGAYPSSALWILRFLSVLVYSLSFFTFLGTAIIYNPENLFGDSLLSSPSSFEIRSEFGSGCRALSAVTGDDFNDLMPLTAVRLRVNRTDPAASPAEFANGTSIDGRILSSGVQITEFGPSFNFTRAVRFELSARIRGKAKIILKAPIDTLHYVKELFR